MDWQNYRVPGFQRTGYPYRVTSKLNPRTETVTIRVTAPSGWARTLLTVLDGLTALVDHMKSHEEQAALQLRTRRRLTWEAHRRRTIYRRYQQFRKQGLLHRAAIKALERDPELLELGWSFSLFNALVRTESQREARSAATRSFSGVHAAFVKSKACRRARGDSGTTRLSPVSTAS